ncbi:hypothetical protein CsSME_00037307 [Camellia sinensis var. sinensis]
MHSLSLCRIRSCIFKHFLVRESFHSFSRSGDSGGVCKSSLTAPDYAVFWCSPFASPAFGRLIFTKESFKRLSPSISHSEILQD